jgi:LmbE family N-acetylglucosaminyl deacetylase
MSAIKQFKKYVFVFAHPDDEVYCCGLMHQLIGKGKTVQAVFLTNGDAGVNAESRVGELKESLAAIGVKESNITLMAIPEKEVMTNFSTITGQLHNVMVESAPDCVVGMDFEGGHEVHDSASFITSKSIEGLSLSHYVFPVYHMEQGLRVGAMFASGLKASDNIPLDTQDVNTKIKVLEAHRGQIGHFLHLQRQSRKYFQRLFSREVFRLIKNPMNYTIRPLDEIGYEAHRNGFKFEDFKRGVERVS